MKHVLFLLLLSHLCFGNDLSVNINSPQFLIQKILNPQWSELPNSYTFGETNLKEISSSISAKLINAKLVTSTSPRPLFDISIIDKNQLKLKWKLEELKIKSVIKIRFKFKMYGVKITHDEYFIIDAQNIKNATTQLSFAYTNDNIQIKNILNKQFELEKIYVRPKNGVGNILKFIFKNILSKRKVEIYLKNQVNILLTNWINTNSILHDLQDKLNSDLAEFRNTPTQITSNGPMVLLNPKTFSITPEKLNLKIAQKIDYTNEKVHDCAKKLKAKDDISIPLSSIEKLLEYFITYEVWDEDILVEPLLCFGYKEYSNNLPVGEKATIQVLGKTIAFNYWISPLKNPNYHYDGENEAIILDLELNLDVSNEIYPLITVSTKNLIIKASLKIEFNFSKNVGIIAKITSVELHSTQGQLKIKPFKFSPWIPLPMNQVRKQLENSINSELQNNNHIIQLVSSKVNLSNNLMIYMESFDITNDSYEINFLIN